MITSPTMQCNGELIQLRKRACDLQLLASLCPTDLNGLIQSTCRPKCIIIIARRRTELSRVKGPLNGIVRLSCALHQHFKSLVPAIVLGTFTNVSSV